MTEQYDIHKAAGIIIENRRLLVERSKGKEHFIAPGGSVESGELTEDALIRELMEEFQISVHLGAFSVYGTFYAEAAGQPGKRIRMDAYLIDNWEGVPTPDNEVEEIRWITSANEEGLKLGSIFEKEIIPRLVAEDYID